MRIHWLLLCLVSVWFLGLSAALSAGTWYPDSEPQLDYIKNGGQEIANNATLVIVDGGSVTLRAQSADIDKLTEDDGSGGTTETFEEDTPQVIWSATNNGKVNNNTSVRVGSNASIIVTFPALGEGVESDTFTVTAKPDDDSTQAPGGPLGSGNGGNRDDAPGPGQTITIKVIRNCPDNIEIAQSCPYPINWNDYWDNHPGEYSYGKLAVRMEVSGGTPPDPPGNWNGLVVKEAVLGPTPVLSAAELAKFEPEYNPNSNCGGSAEFVVGLGTAGSSGNCVYVSADNSFWDIHIHGAIPVPFTTIKQGETQAVSCSQVYKCGGQVIGEDITFTITRTFTDSNYENERRTRVPISKN